MLRISRVSWNLLSIAVGLLFTAAVYHTMHNNPRWDWSAPGVGQLPRDVVGGFMEKAYEQGRGGSASAAYFASSAADNAADAQDRRDGPPIQHAVREVIGQGMTVVVFHRVDASRGEPAQDLIDRFVVKDGRIAKRDRFATHFSD